MTTPEPWEGSIAQAAEWLDRAAFPGAASTLLRAALEAEWSWKAWSETGTPKVTWPQGRPPTLREIPALVYSTPPDFKGFVASCPRGVLPFLASSFYINVQEARAVHPYSLGAFFEESRRPLRESLAAVVPKGKKGKPHTRRAGRIFLEVYHGRPLAEVAEMFGISVQTVRVTVSEERKRRGLPAIRKREV